MTISNAIGRQVDSAYSTTDPIVTASISGWTSFVVGFSFLHRIGNIVTMTCTFAGTPSASTQSAQVQVPYTNPFANSLQGSGDGSMFLTTAPTALNGGVVDAIKSATGTRNIQIDSSCLVGGIASAFTLQVIISYQVN